MVCSDLFWPISATVARKASRTAKFSEREMWMVIASMASFSGLLLVAITID